MNRRHATHLAAVLAVAVVARVVLYDWVGVWIDYGFYAYDTRLIVEGKTPFVDFLGRSPLWLYSYAVVRETIGYSVATMRGYVALWWVLTAVPVYALARQIRDHRTAIVAAAAFAWAPYMLVYGTWVNTMSLAAAMSVTALYLIVSRPHAVSRWLTAGVLFGAAFLTRRSVVALMAACVLFVAVRYRRGETTLVPAARRLAALSAAVASTMLVGYAAVVSFDPAQTWALFETHAINLVLTTGRGGWPLLGVDAPHPASVIGDGRIPIFNDICQLCGVRTARKLAQILLVSAPVTGLVAAVGLGAVIDRWFDERLVPYLTAPLGALALYAVVLAGSSGMWLRVGTVVALVAAVGAARRVGWPQVDIASRPALLMVLVAGGLMIVGYLHRQRVLLVYYALDVWPYLAILAALGGVWLWEHGDRAARVLLVVALVVATVTSGVAAYPVANIVLDDNSAGWHRPSTIQQYNADIQARTDPGDVVLVESAVFVAGTHARMPLDDSRAVVLLHAVYQGDGPTRRTYDGLIGGMRDGDVALVVEDSRIHSFIADNATVTRLFERNYCHVDDPPTRRLYNRTNVELYRYQPDCPAARTPTITQNAPA